jgi:endogenous inhibitor of DNA gyrase (YacG/DUF329 family)
MACPICAKDTHKDYRPFCSKRCADIDLGKWLNEEYSAPSTETDDLDEALDRVHATRETGAAKKDGPLH